MGPPAGQMINPNAMSPEDMQILGLGEIPEKQALLLAQLKQANVLRNQPAPEGRTGPGHLGMYTAPHPLEVLGHLATQYLGQKQAQDVNEKTQELLKQQTSGRMLYWMKKLRGEQGTSGLPGAPGAEEGGPD